MEPKNNPDFDTGQNVEPPACSQALGNATPLAQLIMGKPVYFHDATTFNEHSAFSEKQLCDGYTFTAGTSCAYSCTYCYVESQVYKQNPVRQILRESGRSFEDLVIRRAAPLQRLALALTRKKTSNAKHHGR